MQKKKLRAVTEQPPAEHVHDEHCGHTHSDESAAASSLALVYKLSKEYTEVRAMYDRLLDQTAKALMKCLEMRDPYTYGHSMRVMEYAILIGRGADLPAAELKNLELAAMFHDLGKIGVRDCVLNKETRLDEEERGLISQHPNHGYEILQLIDEFKNISHGVLHHHERLDGKGYPAKAKGDEIPLYSRIILVADTFDAMTSTRPYRKMLPVETAYAELSRFQGTQFDPKFVEIFLREHMKLTGRVRSGETVLDLTGKRKKAA